MRTFLMFLKAAFFSVLDQFVLQSDFQMCRLLLNGCYIHRHMVTFAQPSQS